MFLYNNPYLAQFYNGGSLYIPQYDDGNEVIYDDHDDAYDYKLVDGVWQTRAKGSDGDWVSLEGNEEATNKLNTAYPDAIQDPNNDNDGDNDGDGDGDNDDDGYVGPTGLDIDAANESIGKTNNLDFKNPESGTILDTIGDNPFLSLIHAVGTTINSFKGENYYDPGTKEDYMKISIKNPTDQDMYINPTQFKKSPNKPWKYLEDEEQMIEREFQSYLDDRHERQPDKYGKVENFDSDLYEETGYLNYKDGKQQGDKIEDAFPEATHINWNVDADGNYTTAHSFMQEADDDLPATQFNIGNKDYQAYQFPTPEVQSPDMGADDDGDGVPDYLTPTQKYGSELPKAQSSLNLDLFQSQGILGSEGQGYNPLTNVTLDNNIGGANFSGYGAVNSNASMQSPEQTEAYFNDSDRLYASNQAVQRSMENFEGYKADMNERLQNPSLSMLNTQTSPLSTPSLDQNLLNQTQKISDMAESRNARMENRTFTDDQGNQQIVKSSEQMQEQQEEFNENMQEQLDNIPEYKGTQEALDDLEKSKELGFDSREDYKDFEKEQEEEALARDLREDEIKDANKDDQPSTADKLWNLKNRMLDSKAGQTFGKIGAGAVRIAKPLNKIFADREARKRKADMMNNAYLSDNMVAATEADVTGSKGNYDANTGIFRPDDKVVVGTTGSAKYGSELNRAQMGLEYFKNNYPGYDELTPDQQQQVLDAYSGNSYIPQSQRFDGYSDDYINTMKFKDEYNTLGYNPVINELPNWLHKPNEGFGRIIMDDEIVKRMRGQLASGKLDEYTAKEYARFLATYRGPAAIDYNMNKYDRYQNYTEGKKERFNYPGIAFGYKDDLPGKGAWDTVSGDYSPKTLSLWIDLANKVNNPKKYPFIDQEKINQENHNDFMKEVRKEARNIDRETMQINNTSFDGLIEIPENQEEEENPFAVNQETAISIPEIKVNSVDIKTNSNNVINQISNKPNPVEKRIEEKNEDPYAGMTKQERRKAKRAAMFEDAYIPQTQRQMGGQADIDMNTYKQLIAAGAQIEIL